ncbi:MAG: type II CAAX endopeptidase family protein [Acidimicrobiales bacterium]
MTIQHTPPLPTLDNRKSRTSTMATYVVGCYLAATLLAIAFPGTAENPGPVALLTLLVPATVVGALAAAAKLRHRSARLPVLGLRRGGFRFWPIAVAAPALTIAIPFAIARGTGIVTFHELGLYVLDAPFSLAIMTVLLLGEEVGWRGFLYGELTAALSPRRAALIVGIIHGLFHIPLLTLTNGYDSAGSRWIVVPGVVAVISGAGILFGWLRTRSNSLWPVLIAHAAANTCLLEAPTLVTNRPVLTAAIVGEGGVLTVATIAIAATIIWNHASWTAPARTVRVA